MLVLSGASFLMFGVSIGKNHEMIFRLRPDQGKGLSEQVAYRAAVTITMLTLD